MRHSRFFWLYTLLLLTKSLPAAESPAVPRPNIVFILADDWGWGDLSGHGHPWLKTPNLDRLAREGVDFQQFNVLNPVCSPSRTAIITGRFPARYCIHGHFASPPENASREFGIIRIDENNFKPLVESHFNRH